MNVSDIDRTIVELWAYSTDLDAAFARHFDEDADEIEYQIRSVCDRQAVYTFAADPRCLKRAYFLRELITTLTWIVHRAHLELPWEFSRLQGIQPREKFLAQVARHAEAIYEISALVERMRISGDPLLADIANALLDYRRDKLVAPNDDYLRLLRLLHEKVGAATS
jgi:hypothetical protein